MTRAILLVDHGSRRLEANEVLSQVAAQLMQRVPDVVVRIAHMELAEPTIAQAMADCAASGATELIVHPYFLAPGSHSTSDIPRLVEAAAAEHPGLRIRISEPLGLHPGLVDAILDRVDAAAKRDS